MSDDVDLDDLRIQRREQVDAPGPAPREGARRWPLLVLILLLGGVAVVAFGTGGDRGASRVRVRVERVPLPPTTARGPETAKGFSAAGWVKLPRYHPVRVTPLLEGRVEKIHVIEGDRVEKGQVIARLYARDYEALVAVAEAAVRAARADAEKMTAGYRKQEVAEAKAEVARLEAELEVAKIILKRSRELEPTGAIPREELELHETKVVTLEASIDKARERLALLEEGFRKEEVELANAALAKAEAERDLARLRLGYTEIKSPMDGVVLERRASEGQWLVPREGDIVDLYDPTDLEARVDVNQGDVSRVFLDQEVEISTRAEPRRLHAGKVVLIEPKADLVKNTVPVRVKLIELKGDEHLHPDMVVTARFLTRREERPEPGPPPEITVPVAALQEADGQSPWLLVLEGNETRRVDVVLGERRSDRVIVTKGLLGGERVVVDAPPGLAAGVSVEVVD